LTDEDCEEQPNVPESNSVAVSIIHFSAADMGPHFKTNAIENSSEQCCPKENAFPLHDLSGRLTFNNDRFLTALVKFTFKLTY